MWKGQTFHMSLTTVTYSLSNSYLGLLRMKSDDVGKLYEAIRDVPDFPKPGVMFKDITPLLLNSKLLERAVDLMVEPYRGLSIDKVLGIESRGFILAAPIALTLGVGLVPARKEGKLPWKRLRVEYDLEYGSDVIEIHADGVRLGEQVLVVDDVLATGGTAAAACKAVGLAGGEVAGVTFLIEIEPLGGRKKLGNNDVQSLLTYK